MLGEGNLAKLLRGQYYHPRNEERIFMFLDLQSSTSVAERLGHIRYSTLLQDCFNDMGEMAEDEAEIYQYVGDGAILTWKLERGLRNQNCPRSFIRFKHHLSERKDYYQKEHGCEPLFKTGMNAGVVMVTEVGKYKKEIAYHDDTINTAARIQGKCNEFQKDLLISRTLMKHLGQSAFACEKLGNIELRGKGDLVAIYAVYDGN